MNYAFTSKEHGTFLPSGKVEMTAEQVEAHNAELEAAELAEWAKAPAAFAVYVTGATIITTWRGTVLGRVISSHKFRALGHNVIAIRLRGTNGATYYGRYGADWSQLCRVRKAKA